MFKKRFGESANSCNGASTSCGGGASSGCDGSAPSGCNGGGVEIKEAPPSPRTRKELLAKVSFGACAVLAPTVCGICSGFAV